MFCSLFEKWNNMAVVPFSVLDLSCMAEKLVSNMSVDQSLSRLKVSCSTSLSTVNFCWSICGLSKFMESNKNTLNVINTCYDVNLVRLPCTFGMTIKSDKSIEWLIMNSQY